MRLDRANGACGIGTGSVPEDESGLVVPGHAERQQQDDGAEDQGVEQCEMVEEGFHHSILLRTEYCKIRNVPNTADQRR